MEPLAEASRQVVNLMRPIDFNSLAGSAESDLAVIAAVQVVLQFGARLRGYRIVNQVIEQSEKFSAGHFSTPFFLRK
jgi:hypothetical protein